MTSGSRPADEGRVGDWIEEHDVESSRPRRGLILEVLGPPGHRRYRVRWDEEHEAVHYPAPDARFRRPAPPA